MFPYSMSPPPLN